jgi:hypothetical protein
MTRLGVLLIQSNIVIRLKRRPQPDVWAPALEQDLGQAPGRTQSGPRVNSTEGTVAPLILFTLRYCIHPTVLYLTAHAAVQP